MVSGKRYSEGKKALKALISQQTCRLVGKVSGVKISNELFPRKSTK